MEEKIEQSNSTLHKYLFTVTTFSKLLAMTLFIALPFLGFYLGMKYQQKVTVAPIVSEVQRNPTAITKPTITTEVSIANSPKTQIIAPDNSTNTYINSDIGLSITYHKNIADYSKCQGLYSVLTSDPIKIIEDASDNKIYVASSRYSVVPNKPLGNGFYGAASCTIYNTDLNTIKTPVATAGATTNEQSGSGFHMVVDYKKVISVNDLNSFLSGLSPNNNLAIDSSVKPSQSGNTYSYKLKRVSGSSQGGFVDSWHLLYNPKKKLAVFWISQYGTGVEWADVDSNGKFFDTNPPSVDILE